MDKSNLEKLVVEERNEELKTMLQNSEPSKLVDNFQMTLLHLAAKHNNLELIRYLLSGGFYINARNIDGNTPLAIALFSCQSEAMTILLQSNADIFGVNNEGTSTIEILMRNIDNLPAEVVTCIAENYKRNNLDRETKAEIVAKARDVTLQSVVAVGDDLATTMFLERNYDIELHELSGAVKFAMERQDERNARAIFKTMPFYKQQQMFYDQFHCFFHAEKNDDVKFAELFLKRALEWNVIDEIMFMMDFAARLVNANKELVSELVEKFWHANFDEDIRNKFGIEILASLFGNSNVDPIELLRNKAFIVNGKTAWGYSALHLAVHKHLEKNVRVLLDIGADPNVKDSAGLTPLNLCALTNCTTCGKLLLQYGGDFQLSFQTDWPISSTGFVFFAIAQLAIDDARGIPIGKPLRNKFISKYSSTFEKCLKQIEEFKTHEILDSVTLFTVLTAKSEELARRLRGEDCFSKLEDYCQKREIDPYYDSTLKFKLDRALKMNLAKSNFAKIVSKKTGIMIGFDHLVIDKVFSFLTYYDLLQLI